MKNLYKTTIVIWSEYDPRGLELHDLTRDAVSGESYCSKQETVVVEDPTSDPDWDGTEFFDYEVETEGHLAPPFTEEEFITTVRKGAYRGGDNPHENSEIEQAFLILDEKRGSRRYDDALAEILNIHDAYAEELIDVAGIEKAYWNLLIWGKSNWSVAVRERVEEYLDEIQEQL